MNQMGERFKTVKGSVLVGIFANKLDTYKVNNDLVLHSVEPLLYIRKKNSSDIKYWKIGWMEDSAGDDVLLLKEQNIPEAIRYELIDAPYQKHIIMGSSFSVQPNLILNVSGYGFKENNNEILTSIVLELEDVFISINTGAVIEIKITEEEPNDLGSKIFTTYQ
ncbi:hypothetical protein B14911_16295 [Bacillus sp. NRRL B-14911]|uniref:Uncharacterized protein n=1 Tax=Bacillus infantis NRRL B-14911 TaxID=1367477 RepID=U5L572_9BACI|nr:MULTISPECIES: hypothetical protein [Bacillus]AGX02884.1 hypothetical protein N288_04635 [Bacillus infantis NRRL B-14911]EAR67090.1 hypothetical protein B14911_16295 [Bacillus sp. NRRL B-14911]MCA1035815.1 hypothetical protein [Bacillus infantis]